MNGFEQSLSEAKRLRKRRFIGATLSVLSVFLIGIFTYTYINSFQIVVKPNTIVNYSIKSLGGISISLGNRILLPVGETTIIVSAIGYVDERRVISSDQVEKKIVFHPQYSAVDVSIETASDLTNPNWLIDGLLLSTEENPTLKLKPGNYTLSLYSDYHTAKDTALVIKPGIPSLIKLEVTAKSAKYDIRTIPSNARIFIDNLLVGESPWRGEGNAGLKNLRIEKDGYSLIEEEIDTSKKPKIITRNYNLNRERREISATFSPKNGQLFIDSLPQDTSSTISVNSDFDTEIRYEAEGHRGQTKILSRSENEISVDLKPIFGQLELISTPIAEVFISGKHLGNTPLKVNLLAKRHEISLSAKGYVKDTKTVTVRSVENHKYHSKLISLSDYRLSKSQPQITNSIGMTMTRFLPMKMLIGAPRNQKGQRANEHLRQVAFTRAIYFGNLEVSQAHYATFLAEFKTGTKKTISNDYPVRSVSWEEAISFCNWLSLREGLNPFYETNDLGIVSFNESSLGYRLPTEAEWEYVARFAGKKAPTIFIWGNEYKVPQKAGNLADYSANGSVKIFLADYNDGYAELAPVGSYEAEPSGVYDMSGNVSEWVHDFYSLTPPRSNEENINYMGEKAGSSHVIKGSNYLSAGWTELRASYKETSNKGQIDVGFRIARFIN